MKATVAAIKLAFDPSFAVERVLLAESGAEKGHLPIVCPLQKWLAPQRESSFEATRSVLAPGISSCCLFLLPLLAHLLCNHIQADRTTTTPSSIIFSCGIICQELTFTLQPRLRHLPPALIHLAKS